MPFGNNYGEHIRPVTRDPEDPRFNYSVFDMVAMNNTRSRDPESSLLVLWRRTEKKGEKSPEVEESKSRRVSVQDSGTGCAQRELTRGEKIQEVSTEGSPLVTIVKN